MTSRSVRMFTASMRWVRVHLPDQLSWRSGGSLFVESVTDAIKGLDCIELRIDATELAPDSLDVAVDGAVIDVDVVVIGDVEQLVSRLHHARTLSERFQDQEFGHRKANVLAVPSHLMAREVHYQTTSFQH